MSRIIIKNLPKQITETELKNHFSQKGPVTDICLKFKNGIFRRFAFVGYRCHEDAEAAQKYFNGSSLKHAKINVEICKNFVHSEKPLSWKERKKKWQSSVDGKNQEKTQSVDKKNEPDLLDSVKCDPELDSYLKLHFKDNLKLSQKSNKDLVTTEEALEETSTCDEENKDNEYEYKVANSDTISDMDYLKILMKNPDCKQERMKEKLDLFTVVIRTKEVSRRKGKGAFTKSSIKKFLHPIKYKSLRIPRKVHCVSYVGFKTEKELKQVLTKDKSFIDGVRVRVLEYKKKDGSHNVAPWNAAEERLKSAEPVAESGKIFIRNLWYCVSEENLRELLKPYGEIVELSLPICKATRKPKGFAHITFLFPEQAVRAMNELDGRIFQGRVLHILPGLEKEEQKVEENFRTAKAKEEKVNASSWHNWNSLFLGTSAVVDIMSEKYKRTKQEILSNEGGGHSVAVNVALGESQVIDETKRFLVENGISIDAFTTPGVQRSSTVILAKNLPANTTAQELHDLFGYYGELGRVVLPPSGVSAIIEYLDPSEAKIGFCSLAYSKFKYLPLYLEWAPIQTFAKEYVKAEVKEEKEDTRNVNVNDEEELSFKAEESKEESLVSSEQDTTVYVKNLKFSTTEDSLKEHFEKAGQVYSVLIAKKRGLSQGYGFVQFFKKMDAQNSLRKLQDSSLDGHRIMIKLSEKTLVSQVKSFRKIHDAGELKQPKILLKNIPFQASLQEVRQLFRVFGELKTIRLPKKLNSTEHRGFGFIEFVSKEDAKKAFEALCLSTHLYGRRLVLEWAKEDDSVEEIQLRTAHQFLSGPAKKKIKVKLGTVVEEE